MTLCRGKYILGRIGLYFGDLFGMHSVDSVIMWLVQQNVYITSWDNSPVSFWKFSP